MRPNHIVVIGTSAGGVKALTEVVSQLKKGMDAAFCVVMHLSGTIISNFLVHRLQQYTSLTCMEVNGELPIEKDHIYIASPNRHLLVKKDKVITGYGPTENRWRPSIDVLFRSAAVAYDGNCTGIILTGFLDDGATGMLAIKESGGTCIVQDPNEAEHPDMPMAVLENMEVHYCVPLSGMGNILKEITKTKRESTVQVPEKLMVESAIAEKTITGISHVAQLGERSIYICPDCGGGLWQVEDSNNVSRYRCHIGHAYSETDLLAKQGEQLEATLWVALRIMEERRRLLKKMESEMGGKGFHHMASDNREKGEALQVYIDNLKEILSTMVTNAEK